MKALLLSLGLFALCSTALGQLPHVVSYQGLIRAGDEPVNDPAASIVLRIYEAAELGEPLWSETHTGVAVQEGIFSVLLGSMNPIPFQALPFGQPLWLGVALGEGEEMAPRTPLVAVPYSLVARGVPGLRIESTPEPSGPNVVLGHGTNGWPDGVVGATIGGGGHNDGSSEIWPNRVEGDYGTVGGGRNNRATDFGATVSGGTANVASGDRATVGGGRENEAPATYATVGGGYWNLATGEAAVVGGGLWNRAPGEAAVVSGGYWSYATGQMAVVGGGVQNRATGQMAVVAGGGGNHASGVFATVGGGAANQARGHYSFAAGRNARARHDNSFVWNAPTGPDSLLTTAPYQFLIGATGGVGIGTNAPGADVHIYGDSDLSRPHLLLQETGAGDFARLRMQNSDAGAEFWDIAAGGTGTDRLNFYNRGENVVTFWADDNTGIAYPNLITTSANGARLTQAGVWTNGSSRSVKTAFEPIDVEAVLRAVSSLPVQRWRYRVEPRAVRHIGPVAEDFYAAFGLGSDDKTIGTVDADGVALAAIQGLYQLVQEQQAEIEALRGRVALLEGPPTQ